MHPPLHDDPLLRDVPEFEGYKVLAPCVLYSKLGQGGMGAVYRGKHLNLEIDVAVKCLKRALASEGAAFVQRFQREARLAASIHHQNLVQVYDVSHRNGVHYLVMEYVCGETARDRVVRKGPLKENEALTVLRGAAAGLAEAHLRKIVHRDIKPDNVLISQDGRVKVSDLGLAKAFEGERETAGLTQGGVMGTPQYMAPEQWDDASTVGPATDVWALGATLYFLLTGVDAIEPGSMNQVFMRVCQEPFPDVRRRRSDLSVSTLAVLERCVARRLEQRYPDCGALLKDLDSLLLRESTSLAFEQRGDARAGEILLSPPPPENLAKIRIAVDSQWQARQEALGDSDKTKTSDDDATLVHTPRPSPKPAGAATPPPPAGAAATEPARITAPQPSDRGQRNALPFVIGAGSVLALVALWWAWKSDSGASHARGPVAGANDVNDDPPPPPVTDGPTTNEHRASPATTEAPVNAPGAQDAPPPVTSTEPVEPTPPAPAPAPPPAPPARFPAAEREVRFVATPHGASIRVECELATSLRTDAAAGSRELTRVEGSETGWQATLDLGEARRALVVLIAEPGGASKEVEVVLDVEGPAVAIVEPRPRARERAVDLSALRLSLEDQGIGLAESATRATLDGEAFELVRSDALWRLESPPALPPGRHELRIDARDQLGHANSASLVFELDPAPPTLQRWSVNGALVSEAAPARATAHEPVVIELEFDEPVRLVRVDPGDFEQASGERERVLRLRRAGASGEHFAFTVEFCDELDNAASRAFSIELELAPRVPPQFAVAEQFELYPEGNLARFVRDTRSGVEFALVERTESELVYYARRELSIGEYQRIRTSALNASFLDALRAKTSAPEGEPIDAYPIANLPPLLLVKEIAKFGYRLPTALEAQRWANAGASAPWSFAVDDPRQLETVLSAHAWFAQNANSRIQRCGGKLASSLGLFDVYGNVREWCVDDAGRYAPLGGSFLQSAQACRLDAAQPTLAWSSKPSALADTGFRLVYVVPAALLSAPAASVDPRSEEPPTQDR